MTKIIEDYVNFETAKLLKEKGFPQDPYMCNTAYTLRGKLSNNAKSFAHNAELFNKLNIKPRTYTIAPTLQMARKWLEKIHGIHLNIIYNRICDKGYWGEGHWTWNNTEYNSYENALEAAIKYCLENLI